MRKQPSLNTILTLWLDSTDDLISRVKESELPHGRPEDAALLVHLAQSQILVAELLARKASFAPQKYKSKLKG